MAVCASAWYLFYTYWAMASDQTFITRKGYEKLHKELAELKGRRPMISAAIKEAREKGDLKENAEYHAAKEEMAHNQRRIEEIEGKLSGARILEDQGDLPTDKAYIGATVAVSSWAPARRAYLRPRSSGLACVQAIVART